MKPETAAKKLGVYLPATPESFRGSAVTREQFAALQSDPPQWLVDLRRDGPHPRDVVARKLGVSTSGLGRAGVKDALTTEQIRDEVNGLLIKGPDRARALAEGLARLMTDDGLRSQLGDGAPASVARYSLKSVADAWERLLERIVHRAG